MSILSQRVQAVKPSPTLVITAKALEMAAAGRKVISLSAGEPDYDTPNHIKLAAQEAISQGKTKYTAVDGIKPLKEAIRHKFISDNGLHYDLNQINVANGAKQIIFNCLAASINPGDEVIIPAPYWVSYLDMVLLVEGKCVIVDCPSSQQFKITAPQLQQAITTKTKWLLLNSPSNPTGVVYSQEELAELAAVLEQHPHVWVLSDDIYEHIIFSGSKFCTMAMVAPQLRNRIVIANGVSKSHSMTGWRLGYGAGPKELITAMNTIQSQTTSNACSISQYAALAALNGPILKDECALLEQRRDLVMSLLAAVEGLELIKPQGAFYLFIGCDKFYGRRTDNGQIISNSDDFCQYLLSQFEVATVPGSAFGMANYFRISYATSNDNLTEACQRIAQACAKLIG